MIGRKIKHTNNEAKHQHRSRKGGTRVACRNSALPAPDPGSSRTFKRKGGSTIVILAVFEAINLLTQYSQGNCILLIIIVTSLVTQISLSLVSVSIISIDFSGFLKAWAYLAKYNFIYFERVYKNPHTKISA